MLSRHSSARLAIASLLTGAIGAQTQQLVFPSNAEGVSHATLPGVRGDHRLQILLPERDLTALRGRWIDALTFRRDGRIQHALAGGAVDLTVTLSTTSADPQRTSTVFAHNHGAAPTIVFDGRITVPAAPAVSGVVSFDDPQQTIVVPFTSSFAYGSGSLVIDLTGTRASAPASLWPVDFAVDLQNASATARGAGCGPWAQPSSQTASVGRDGLVPGSTTRFVTWSSPGSAALLMIGVQPTDLDLGAFGAAGCRLLVNPLVAMPTVALPRSTGPGVANLRLHWPSTSNLLGAPLLTQWAHVEFGRSSQPPSLTTSNAVDVVLASTLPVLGASVVRSLPPTAGSFPLVGDVTLQRAPVLQITYR